MFSLLKVTSARGKETTTSFAHFIRSAKADEKKRVYSNVLAEATTRQNDVVQRQRA
jgi:hypothetical protein